MGEKGGGGWCLGERMGGWSLVRVGVRGWGSGWRSAVVGLGGVMSLRGVGGVGDWGGLRWDFLYSSVRS